MTSQVFAEHKPENLKHPFAFDPNLPRIYIFMGEGYTKLVDRMMKTPGVQIVLLEENNSAGFLEKVGAFRTIGESGDYRIDDCGDLVGN